MKKKKKGKEAMKEIENKDPIKSHCTSKQKKESSAIEKGELSEKKSGRKKCTFFAKSRELR